MNIQDVEGIGPAYAEKLAEAGVGTTDALLERGATPRGRGDLADATGISGKLILEWVNHVDLMRLDGVGSEYADLLEAAGVDSPLELARRNATNLARTFQELDAARPDMVRRVPSEATVAGWVEQAKSLPRAVFHDNSGPDAPDKPADAVPAAEPAAVEAATAMPAAPEPEAVAQPEAVAEPAPEPEPVAQAVTRAAAPTLSPAVTAPAPVVKLPTAAPKPQGLWARIKKAIGRG
jgi:predicted flap endonuclease-1-like 5' DNA nuclease